MDEDIFVFRGLEWVMKIDVRFFFWRSLNRCKAVMKNAFLHYDMNKDELRRLHGFMYREVLRIEKDGQMLEFKDKFQKLLTYYDKEVEKHG